MSLIEKLAMHIGAKSKLSLDINEEGRQVIVYGAINLLQMIWAIIWITVVSLIFGVFYEAILFSIVISILRKYSGGVHASSPNRCVFIGTFVAVAVGILLNTVLYKISIFAIAVSGIIFLLISLAIVIRKAPVDSLKKPINNMKIRQRFKFLSVSLLWIYLIIMLLLLKLYTIYNNFIYIKAFQCIALGVLWQSITLTNNGAKILNKVDAVLKYIFERRN